MEGPSPTARPAVSTVHSRPIKRIIVGVSDGQASRDAIVLAKAFTESVGAGLIAASVRPFWPALLGPERYCRLVNEDMERMVNEVKEVDEEVSFSTRVVAGGHEGGGLTRLASAEGADLIVLGSGKNGPSGRVTPGSLGERILESAPCAVALAPLGLEKSGTHLRELAVAIDGSREARVAQRIAFGLAEVAGSHLSVLGVVEPEPDPAAPGAASRQLIREARVRRHLDQAMEDAPPQLSVSTHLLHGPPARMLTEATATADLLLLGSRSRYRSSRFLSLGSVAGQVIRQSQCATLVAPPA